jgi:AcrR family transcriptional regulator
VTPELRLAPMPVKAARPRTNRPTTATRRQTKARPRSAPVARRTRDPEAMRSRVLGAAIKEFSTAGYGGARVERISRGAGTVDRMLYYYFGNKDDLFRAVLEDAYEKLGAAEQQLRLADTEPVAGMRQLVSFTWDYYVQHPEFIRLLNSENLHRGEHVRKSRRVKSLSFPLLSILTDLLARGAREGKFRAGIDPVHIYLTIAALAYFYLSNRYTLSRFLGMDLMSAEQRARWLEHITAVVLGHIAPAASSVTTGPRGAVARSDFAEGAYESSPVAAEDRAEGLASSGAAGEDRGQGEARSPLAGDGRGEGEAPSPLAGEGRGEG